MNAINRKTWKNLVAMAVLTTAAVTTTATAGEANTAMTAALMGEMVVTAKASTIPLIGTMQVVAYGTRDVADLGAMEVVATRTTDVADLGAMTVTAQRTTQVAQRRTGGGDVTPATPSRARTPRAVLVQ